MRLSRLNVVIRFCIAIVLFCTILALVSMDTIDDEEYVFTNTTSSFRSYTIDNKFVELANNLGSRNNDKLINAIQLNNVYYILIYANESLLDEIGYYIISLNNTLEIENKAYLGTTKPDVFDTIDNRILIIIDNKKYLYSEKLAIVNTENFNYNGYINGIYYNKNGDLLLNNNIIYTDCNDIKYVNFVEKYIFITSNKDTYIMDTNGNILFTYEGYMVINVLYDDGYLINGYIDNDIIITKLDNNLDILFTFVTDGALLGVEKNSSGYQIEYIYNQQVCYINICNHGDIISKQTVDNLSSQLANDVYLTFAGNIYIKPYNVFINGDTPPTKIILINNILFASSTAVSNDFKNNYGGEDIFIFKLK